MAHRRVGRDLSLAHVLLNRLWQGLHQRQATRHPTRALRQTRRQLFLIQALLTQRLEQPALLEHTEPLGAALAAVQQESIALVEVPDSGGHGVAPQALEAAQALETVDDQVTPGLKRHDDDGHLLALVRQRSQQASLALGSNPTQTLVASVELVKLQIHGGPPVSDRLKRGMRQQQRGVCITLDLVFSIRATNCALSAMSKRFQPFTRLFSRDLQRGCKSA